VALEDVLAHIAAGAGAGGDGGGDALGALFGRSSLSVAESNTSALVLEEVRRVAEAKAGARLAGAREVLQLTAHTRRA